MATCTTSDGTKIFYRVRGEGRPAFVFVHGWCSNLEHWAAQIRHFSKRHRVLALDRRGHGRSDVPAIGYTARQHAADLAEIMGRERIRSAIVVGHAGGGPTTLELARSHPRLVKALVLVDSNVGPKPKLDDPDDPAGAGLRSFIQPLEGRNGAEAFRKIYGDFFSRHAGPAGRRALAEALETPLDVAIAELRSLAIDSRAIARRLEQPVLWLTVAGADQAALGKVFRDVQFGQVVGSGHFPHVEVPDQTNAMIERFVSTLPR